MVAPLHPEKSALADLRGRPLHDLRVSVTDRCNFRCRYCMPKEKFDRTFLPKSELLTFEEITRLVRLLQQKGLCKVRLTGGEPLLRTELPKLIQQLRKIPNLEIALTTNGALLKNQAASLAEAGLHRITVSLDSLDEVLFQQITDTQYTVRHVLGGIAAAERAGFFPIKINCVVRRGLNDTSLLQLVQHFKGTGHILRFIEYMDVGTTNGWVAREVVPEREILATLHRVYPLEALAPNYPGEVARRYQFQDGSGEIGVIASVTRPFCGDCSRLRLSSDGQLFTCLFSQSGHDIRTLLRSGAEDQALCNFITELWRKRADRYSELRAEPLIQLKRAEMSYLGG